MNGVWTVTTEGSPGPVYWEGTYDGKTRRGSSKSVMPAGALQLGELPYVLQGLGDGVLSGVLNALAVSAGTGLGLTIATGAALVKGVQFTNHTISTNGLTADTAHATLPRIDTVVVEVGRLTRNDEGRAEMKLVAGTAAASPVAPALTQTNNTWQYPLADVRVNAAATAITSVTDRRTYLLSGTITRNPQVVAITRRTNTASVNLTTSATDIATLNVNPVLVSGVTYDIMVEASVLLGIGGSNCTVDMAPYIGTTADIADYLGHNISNRDIAITNTHRKLGVVGAGVAVACGVLAKKSNSNSANYSTGIIVATCTPRS